MIPTRHILFDGVMLTVPVMPNGKMMVFEALNCEDYPTFCGPGKLGDKIVPDRFFGINCAVACHIHDVMRALACCSEDDFKQHNKVFHDNLCAIIHEKQEENHLGPSLHQCLIYFMAVNCEAAKDRFMDKEKT